MKDAILISILILLGICIMMIMLTCKSQRRKAKSCQEDINLGDKVKTIGGIMGVVVSFTKDEITIESGSKGSEIVISREAVNSVNKEC